MCPIIWQKTLDHLISFVSATGNILIQQCVLNWIGGFNWNLDFFWEWLPAKDRARRLRDPTYSFKTPAIAGGLFAIGRKWFLELGAYDEGMEVSWQAAATGVTYFRNWSHAEKYINILRRGALRQVQSVVILKILDYQRGAIDRSNF